ncbi:uncharacterized protein LOC143371161 [Andrena cerasifolii]|uniref:uncharacterized protein LOC143371161 n=1 Tax=Andrena cerasifolii TaxID=2819439 RepID=UPI004038262E
MRRTFDAITHELQSYSKKPKLVETLMPVDLPSRSLIPANMKTVNQIDLARMLSHALKISNTPMWVGFNSLIYDDKSTKQNISYLTAINVSPTNTHVVIETMVQSQKVAQECGESYMQITYDLAIAKTALQIQSTEKPRFDNLFIHIGAFHIMMAYFKAIGKFIDNCGLSNIMVDTEMLASGSVNGLITGKHFNRCKRLHPLVSLAVEILHFESFMEVNNIQVTDEMKIYLEEFKNHRSMTPVIEHEDLMQVFDKYEDYKKQTILGIHGKTPQYYMIYTNLVHYYLMLYRSIRSADFEMFKFVLQKIANIFFIFNQQNYSRYLVKYIDNLLKIDDTHPGLRLEFERGSFGIRRTNKPFSRQPIDLTLEQTINADAANKLTGVIHTSNSISARQRWCKSHSIRAKIISYVMEESGLRNRQDITADLEKNRIRKSSLQLQTLMSNIKNDVNPFSTHLHKDFLYNISSGQSVNEIVSEFLLNIEKNGNILREQFIAECVEDECRFERRIKQNKIYTFTETLKKKLYIRQDKVLTYPLTPVPLSLCHIDGTMCKTDKSALLKLLQNNIDKEPPQRIDVIVFDEKARSGL